MNIFKYIKSKRKKQEVAKQLAEKLAKEKAEKEGIIAEKLIPTNCISLLLLNETDKVSSEPRIFEIKGDVKFDKFIPTIKTGVKSHCDMKTLNPVDVGYSIKINGYSLSDYTFFGWCGLDISTKTVIEKDNNYKKYQQIEFSNNGNVVFKERIPESLSHISDDINNGYVKIKDILSIFDIIQEEYKENYNKKLKENVALSNKIKADRFLSQVKAGKTSYDDLTTM